MLRHLPLILPNIHIIELGRISSLLFDLLGYLAVGKDTVTLECTINSPEATFLDLVPTFQPLNHLHMASRIIKVDVELWRIGCADFSQTSFSAP